MRNRQTTSGDRVRLTALLLCVYALAFAHRQLPAMLADPIAGAFGLGDTALGALHGYGFALSYAVMALPAGWLADRMPRLRLLGMCLLLWSIATIACGLALSLTGFVAGRIVVGLGQAVLMPAAYSLLGDVWPRSRTGLSVASFAIGPFLGFGLMLLLGGQLAEAAGWRLPFFIAGLCGIAMALFLLGLIDPPRQAVSALTSQLWRNRPRYIRAYLRIILLVDGAMLFTAMAANAVLGWGVAWLTRTHGLALGAATLSLGSAVLLGGLIGTFAGGMLGDRMARQRRSRMDILAMALLCAAPVAWTVFIVDDIRFALAALTVLIALIAVTLANGPAVLQEITPPSLRGLQHGLAVFLINVFGFGLGPLLIGLGSENLVASPQKLGKVLAMTVPIMLALGATAAVVGARAAIRVQTASFGERAGVMGIEGRSDAD